MPRGYKHKSHRQHKHGGKDLKEVSESDGDERVEVGNLKEGSSRKSRDENARGVRVPKESPESGEKRKFPASEAGDLFAPGNEEIAGEYFPAKRWKDRGEIVVSDRWNGEADGSLEARDKGFGSDVLFSCKEEKGAKVWVSEKARGSGTHEGSNKDETGAASVASVDAEEGKRNSTKGEGSSSKRKSDRELKEAHQSEGKEKARDRKEIAVMVSEGSKSQKLQSTGTQEERTRKREVENSEWHLKDQLRNPVLEKELDKHTRRGDGSREKDKGQEDRRGDGSREKDKWQEEVRDGNDRHLSSVNDRATSGGCKDERDERCKDANHRDKYREDIDRDHRHRDEKHREDRSLQDRNDERSDGKHIRDEIRSGSHRKKNKPESDRESSPVVDRSTRAKESRAKRASHENEDGSAERHGIKEANGDLVHKVAKSSQSVSLKDRSNTHSNDTRPDIGVHLSKNQCKSSPSNSKHIYIDQQRNSTKQMDTKSPSEGIPPWHSVSPGRRSHTYVSSVTERVSETQSNYRGRLKHSGHSDESTLGCVVADSEIEADTYHIPVGRSPGLDSRPSPVPLTKKPSLPVMYEHRHSNGSRGSFDVDESKRVRGSSRDANHCRDLLSNEVQDRDSPMEKSVVDIYPQNETLNAQRTPRNSCGNSSSQLPPLWHGVDSPLMDSSEEDSRSQASDRKFNGRQRRNNDLSLRRAQQGNAWKGMPTWIGPAASNFIPFQPQVGLPPAGFHSVIPQFPAAPIFGIRPPIELNHAGLPFHMHDADRFSSHGRPFGWCNPGDDAGQSPIQGQLHGWDAGGTFSEDSHLYGKSDWDQNRHFTRGLEKSAEMWKGQNGSLDMDLPVRKDPDFQGQHPAEEPSRSGQSGPRSRHERQRPDRLPAESIEIKRSEDAPETKLEADSSVRPVCPKGPDPKKISGTNISYYLSELDISVDLAGPDLYEKYMHMRGSKGEDAGDTIVIPEKSLSGSVVYVKNTTKIGKDIDENGAGALLYPGTTTSLFEKSLILYRNQIEQSPTQRFPFSASGLESKNDGPPCDVDMLEPSEVSFSPQCSSQALESHSKKNELGLEYVSSEDHDACVAAVKQGDIHQSESALDFSAEAGMNAGCRGDSMIEPDEDLNISGIRRGRSPSMYPSQVEINEPVCEALKPDLDECSTHLIRIHDSLENTH